MVTDFPPAYCSLCVCVLIPRINKGADLPGDDYGHGYAWKGFTLRGAGRGYRPCGGDDHHATELYLLLYLPCDRVELDYPSLTLLSWANPFLNKD